MLLILASLSSSYSHLSFGEPHSVCHSIASITQSSPYVCLVRSECDLCSMLKPSEFRALRASRQTGGPAASSPFRNVRHVHSLMLLSQVVTPHRASLYTGRTEPTQNKSGLGTLYPCTGPGPSVPCCNGSFPQWTSVTRGRRRAE